MANTTIYNVDLANLFVGNDDPTKSEFLVLKNLKIPALQEKTRDFSPGGGVVDMKLGTRKTEALELTFQLEGPNPDVMKRFMRNQRIDYTVRANVRDVQTHEDIPMKAIISGRMVKNEMSQFASGDGVQSDYMISEVMRYQLWFNHDEKYYFDAFAGPLGVRIDGVAIFRRAAANLGL